MSQIFPPYWVPVLTERFKRVHKLRQFVERSKDSSYSLRYREGSLQLVQSVPNWINPLIPPVEIVVDETGALPPSAQLNDWAPGYYDSENSEHWLSKLRTIRLARAQASQLPLLNRRDQHALRDAHFKFRKQTGRTVRKLARGLAKLGKSAIAAKVAMLGFTRITCIDEVWPRK